MCLPREADEEAHQDILEKNSIMLSSTCTWSVGSGFVVAKDQDFLENNSMYCLVLVLGAWDLAL